jgi:peptidoglycan-N-acetylglucosamine deacetylase
MIDVMDLMCTGVPRLFAGALPGLLWRVPHDADEKVAYLTFDDGPSRGATDTVLDILDRHQAKATFFLIGAKAKRSHEMVRTLVAGGHRIGNHTFTHVDPWRVSSQQLTTELEMTRQVLQDVSGVDIQHVRPPYGRMNRTLARWAREHDHLCVMWDIAPADWLPSTTADLVFDRIMRRRRAGSIIVLHDTDKSRHAMPAALDRALSRLTEGGWRFPVLPPPPLVFTEA